MPRRRGGRGGGGGGGGSAEVWWERQSGANCRVHAVNNAVGRAALTAARFYEECARFDRRHGMEAGLSERYTFFADGGDTVITACIRALGYAAEPVAPPAAAEGAGPRARGGAKMPRIRLADIDLSGAAGAVVWDMEHCWALRRDGGRTLVVDSVRSRQGAPAVFDPGGRRHTAVAVGAVVVRGTQRAATPPAAAGGPGAWQQQAAGGPLRLGPMARGLAAAAERRQRRRACRAGPAAPGGGGDGGGGEGAATVPPRAALLVMRRRALARLAAGLGLSPEQDDVIGGKQAYVDWIDARRRG